MSPEPESAQARGYLLGEASEEECSTLERAYFHSDDAVDRIAAAEGDLIEDYLSNRLDAAGRTRFERAYYRIVHFATHGLIDSDRPELSGLILSLVNERGAPLDGFLRLPDIFSMRLNADLVVLSACQTALGKEIKGEGLVGLTRGFMYAGAPRVVASLWQVSDLATADLMKRFYAGMLQRHLPAAAALRAARSSRWPEIRDGRRRTSGRGSSCRETGSDSLPVFRGAMVRASFVLPYHRIACVDSATAV